MAAGHIRPQALDRIVDAAVTRPGAGPREILAPFVPPPAPDLDALVGDAVARARTMDGRSPGTLLRWAVGEVIPHTLGHADPREVQRRLEERLTAIGVGAAR
jgi:hypothetical protein